MTTLSLAFIRLAASASLVVSTATLAQSTPRVPKAVIDALKRQPSGEVVATNYRWQIKPITDGTRGPMFALMAKNTDQLNQILSDLEGTPVSEVDVHKTLEALDRYHADAELGDFQDEEILMRAVESFNAEAAFVIPYLACHADRAKRRRAGDMSEVDNKSTCAKGR